MKITIKYSHRKTKNKKKSVFSADTFYNAFSVFAIDFAIKSKGNFDDKKLAEFNAQNIYDKKTMKDALNQVFQDYSYEVEVVLDNGKEAMIELIRMKAIADAKKRCQENDMLNVQSELIETIQDCMLFAKKSKKTFRESCSDWYYKRRGGIKEHCALQSIMDHIHFIEK